MRSVWATVLGLVMVASAPLSASAAPLDGVLEAVAAAAAAEARKATLPVSNAPLVAEATPEEALENRDLDALSAMLDRHDADAARLADAAKPQARP